MKNEIKKSNLKEKLDQIDFETISEALPSFVETKILEKKGMWKKGWAVIEAYPEAKDYKAENIGGEPSKSLGGFSWMKLERETGRPDITIKSWVQLAKHIGKGEKAFKVWAEKERPLIEGRFKRKMLPPPETPALPPGEFDIWLADPPWLYDFAQSESRSIRQKYPPMTTEMIKSMKIPDGQNIVLFLWATAPKLKEALETLSAWGFDYKTHAVWDKEIIGMGYWFRGQHELLLVGTKGKGIPPDESNRVSSIIRERRSDNHSEKPIKVYEIIESLFPDQNKIELFSTKSRKGWTPWGINVK